VRVRAVPLDAPHVTATRYNRATGDHRDGERVGQGLILGRYRPLAELGEGGHGAVDLAFDTKMARRVAIKRIPLSHAGVRRLGTTTGLAEARTSALLNHPNVVTVFEWDTDADEAFLIMEHVDGAPLSDLLDAYAPLEPDEAAAVLDPVCAALSFAHDNGVLHLDLKPENVLVTRDGRRRDARLHAPGAAPRREGGRAQRRMGARRARV
jgi:serine/threonine protein kinase